MREVDGCDCEGVELGERGRGGCGGFQGKMIKLTGERSSVSGPRRRRYPALFQSQLNHRILAPSSTLTI